MMRFLDLLFPPRTDEDILRAVSTDSFLAHMAPQLVSGTSPETIALLPFAAAPVRAAIHEAKYHGSEHAFALLAATLAEYLRDDDARLRKPIIVPVPLGKERRKERGFNQTEEVAQRTLHILGGEAFILEPNLLTRIRETPSQVSLPRDTREENMRGAFSTVHPADPMHTYIVIDDVITTGATLRAATHALMHAGAAHIVPLALAH
jgi:ComF family protein